MNNLLDKKELQILRKAIDLSDKINKKKKLQNPIINEIMSIVETFIIKKKLICYGGTAINNILPDENKFYNKEVDLPDYDFFSFNAIKHAKDLCDLYKKHGYKEILASSGVHHGTYKVFVNFIPVADITQLPRKLYDALHKNALVYSKIHYAPANYLRMSMYLELSRPEGDISRWEKVLRRLVLLNNTFPLKYKNCKHVIFQRPLYKKSINSVKIYNIVKDSFIQQNVVFFGAFAASLYGEYMPKTIKKKISKIPDFDVLCENPEKVINYVKNTLLSNGITNVTYKKHNALIDIIPIHYELIIDKDTVAFLYTTIACHNYNLYTYHNQTLKIATIDTMLSFYLAFLYANKPYYNNDRILCMAHYLFIVQQKNRLAQKGLLKRFSHTCYGTQTGREELREIRQNKYKELKTKKTSEEYESWFLKYDPYEKKNTTRKKIVKSKKNKTKKNN